MTDARAAFYGALAGVVILVAWRMIPTETKAGWARAIVAANHRLQGGCADCPEHKVPVIEDAP
jgi:hypothetical protein